uniref:BOS complex subunit NCLN n=1 Tax=Plectus sambesii TaxID=2011161 RepID=A0A914VSA6_9BILA
MTAMHEDLVDAVRSPVILIYMFIVLPITLAVAPLGDTVELDFHAYRLQHFDLQGTQYGSRGWRVMYEAAALDSKTLLRRCLVTLWRDLVNRDLSQTFDKTLGAALIIIPADLDALSGQDRQLFLEFERQLVSQAYDVAVYVAPSTPQLRETLVSLQTAQRHEQSSAFSALLHAVTANSFQITSDFQGSSVKLEQPLFNVVGKLSAFERSSDVSTIAIVAHYDSFGAAPALSFGADSNGSGVAALLELMRILHRFYQTAKTRAKYNLVFLLSSGGKLNYQGSRQWIEEFLEATQNI